MEIIYKNDIYTKFITSPSNRYFLIYGVGSEGRYIGIFTNYYTCNGLAPSYDELLMLDHNIDKEGNIIILDTPRKGMSICENDIIWELNEDEVLKHLLMETI